MTPTDILDTREFWDDFVPGNCFYLADSSKSYRVGTRIQHVELLNHGVMIQVGNRFAPDTTKLIPKEQLTSVTFTQRHGRAPGVPLFNLGDSVFFRNRQWWIDAIYEKGVGLRGISSDGSVTMSLPALVSTYATFHEVVMDPVQHWLCPLDIMSQAATILRAQEV